MSGYMYWLVCWVYFLIDKPSAAYTPYFQYTATASENKNLDICNAAKFLCADEFMEIAVKFIWNAAFILLVQSYTIKKY